MGQMTSTTVHVLDLVELRVGASIDTPPLQELPTSPRPRRHSNHSKTITSTTPPVDTNPSTAASNNNRSIAT
jgi:hypothetical protein